jgi:Tfp pilus assembly protein PilO
MPVRTRLILVVVGFVVVTILWFLVLWKPAQNKVNTLLDQQRQQRQEQATLEANIKRLKDLQQQEPRLRAEIARLQDSLPADPRLPDFILQLQESASLAGIDFLTISPSVPSPYAPPAPAGAPAAAPPATTGGQLQSVTVSVTANGKYFEVLDFIVRLEKLRRAVRVNTISMAPGTAPGAPPTEQAVGVSPNLSVTFAMQMFLVSPVAAGAAAPAPAPTPGPTASPGTTAVPGGSPSPAATAGAGG